MKQQGARKKFSRKEEVLFPPSFSYYKTKLNVQTQLQTKPCSMKTYKKIHTSFFLYYIQYSFLKFQRKPFPPNFPGGSHMPLPLPNSIQKGAGVFELRQVIFSK